MRISSRQEAQVRAGCYLRISSDPNDKREGVARQREDTSALCEIKDWTVAGYYEDNDTSASSGEERKHWNRLLADVKAGKIDAIAAWDQDRGWRMMSELEELRKFFTGLGRQVPLATTGQGDIDLYSPTGILAAQIKTAFDAIDTTKNGALSPEEWDTASFALFRAADKNNNNVIDATELQGSTIAQDTFLRADTDRDGKLSIGEFMELRRGIFRIADIDRNDYLNFVEFELLLVMEQVGWTDRNNNGRIELSELDLSLRKIFALLDADTDGQLAPAEVTYLQPEAFKKYDTNADGRLTAEEFIAGYRATLTG